MLTLISKAVWLSCAVGWYLLRRPHQRRASKTPVVHSARTTREMVSLAMSTTGLGIIPAIYVLTGWISFADRSHHWLLLVLGTACFAMALILFRLTHKALGKFWSVSLDLRQEHRLITDGIYKSVRHPMYTGFWLWAVAQFLLLPNWIAGLSGIIFFGILYFQRVGREEQMMEARFGQDYRDYCARTGRLIPKMT